MLQLSQFLEVARGFRAVALFNGVICAAHVRYIFQADLPRPDVLVNAERHLPNQRRPRDCLQHPQVAPLHPPRQIDFSLLGKQTYRAHLAQVHPYRIVRMVGSFLGVFLRNGLRIIPTLRFRIKELGCLHAQHQCVG